jgi:raffinose/stachyose/melibiose transport system permease protein
MDVRLATKSVAVKRPVSFLRKPVRPLSIAKAAILSVTLTALAIVAVLPFYMVLNGSLKYTFDLFRDALGLPPKINWGSFVYVVEAGFLRNMLNTVIVNIVCLTIIAFTGSLASFALVRLRLPGRNLIRLAIISGMMIPVYSVVFPLFFVMQEARLSSSYMALIGPYVAFGLPFAIFVLSGYMKTIPYELDEAAKLDGASPFQIYRDIILPLCRPGLAAVLIFEALWIWNEMPFALVLVKEPAMKTIAVTLLFFGTNWAVDWPKTLAAVVLTTFPILLFYILLSEQFIKGLTAGAVKQ